MDQTEIPNLNGNTVDGNTETKNLVYTNNIGDAPASSARPHTLDVVVQYAVVVHYVGDNRDNRDNFYEEDDDLLDDPEDGKLSEELEGIVYGNSDSNTSEQHYFSREEDEPEYGQPDFMLVDRYFASLFEEENEISYFSPLGRLYKPAEYDPSLYVLSPAGERGEGGEEADFSGSEGETSEEQGEAEKPAESTGNFLDARQELNLEERLVA